MGIQITSKHNENIGSSEERLTVGPWITTKQELNRSFADSLNHHNIITKILRQYGSSNFPGKKKYL